MMKAEMQQVLAGKLDSSGNVVPYEDTSFEMPPEFELKREQTLEYYIHAVEDIEGIEATTKFSGEETPDTVNVSWSDAFNSNDFDLQSDYDVLKNELWFSITEKSPGTQDFVGDYKFLDVTLTKERGKVHIYVKLKN